MKRKTHEDYIAEVYNLVGDEYAVLSEYVNSKTKVKIRHEACGCIYEVLPFNLLKGRKCPECRYKSYTKTHEDFLKEVFDTTGSEYSFMDTYINSMTKLYVAHNICGYQYKVSPNSFLSKESRCPKCQQRKLKTTLEFSEDVFNDVGDDYVVVGEYINSAMHIDILHNECGKTYKVTPNRFLQGTRCPYCTSNATLTQVEFQKRVFDLVGDEYVFVEDYINSQTPIEVKHEKCGFHYKTTPNNFFRGNKCGKCSGKHRVEDDFVRDFYNCSSNEYEYLGGYQDSSTKVEVRHKTCNHNYSVTPTNFLHGRRCPKCKGLSIGKSLRKSNEKFLSEVHHLEGDGYEFLDEYITSEIKLRVKHKECNHIYKVAPYSFLDGNRCPKCRASRGEKRIIQFLESTKMDFTHQYKDHRCKGVKVLPFDFKIECNNKSFLIEYDGKQHFEPVCYAGISMQSALKNYQSQLVRDNIKNQFCKDNNIELLRIPYWDFEEIETIIFNKLVELNILQEVLA